MADANIQVTEGTGKLVDTRTNAAGDHRQVVVLGNPTATDSVAEVQATDPSSDSLGLVVRDVNTSAIVARLGQTIFVQFDPGHSLGTVTANAGSGSFTVQFDPGHTLGNIATVASVTNITNSISVHVLSTAGTINVALKPGTLAVSFDPGYTIGNIGTVGAVTNITNSVAVHLLSTSGTINIQLKPGTLAVSLDPGHLLGSVTANAGTGTMTVVFDPGHELGTIRGNSNTLTIFIPDTGHTIGKVDAGAGTFTFKTDPGYTLGKVDQGSGGTSGWLANIQGTASIFTVAGSTSGISVSGVTLISPSANASFKIYAFSLQTTGQVSLVAKFTNGAGSGPTEFFRPLITASGVTGAQGANLASAPGQPLFVTGTSTTLSLVLDTATLVHYSISYTKESA